MQVRILCGAPQYIIDDDSERRELITYKVRLYLVSENNQVLLYYAVIAQLVEQLICNQQVGGSSPSDGSILRSIAQFGRALGLGPSCRRFKSCYSDHMLIIRVQISVASAS